MSIKKQQSKNHIHKHATCTTGRVAPLRMGVGRADPGTQVLPDLVVVNCPWKTTFADQDNFWVSLLEKRPRDFFCSILVRTEILLCGFAVSQRFCCFQIRTEKCLCLFFERGQDRLPWSADVALQGQSLNSKSGMTWVPGTTLQTRILKGATLAHTGIQNRNHDSFDLFNYHFLHFNVYLMRFSICCLCIVARQELEYAVMAGNFAGGMSSTIHHSSTTYSWEKSCTVRGFRDISLRIGFYSYVFQRHPIRVKRHQNRVLFRCLFDLKVHPTDFIFCTSLRVSFHVLKFLSIFCLLRRVWILLSFTWGTIF